MSVEQQAEHGTMTPMLPIHEVAHLLAAPQETAIRTADAESIQDPALADAEEEEMALLWAADPGNQGA